MKKKIYSTPATVTCQLPEEEILAGSVTSSDADITFGGYDNSGAIDPYSRSFSNLLE